APVAGSAATPSAKVAAVAAEHHGLAGDLLYRIENSALFDDAAPLTREFQLALMRWEDARDAGDEETVHRAAAEVELSFRTAKSNAETLGLTHLPVVARAKARKALDRARLAMRATSAEEREAALAHVAALLDALELYYLPAPADVPRMFTGS
ncbi:hypothetical protein ACFQ06_00395, partial [Tessaracoccus lubricantis]